MNQPIKKINQRQIRHLLKALKQSGYYFKSLEKKNLKIDSHFMEGLQLFLLDSRGKNVRRVVNAFRAVDDSFLDVGNTDFIDNQICKAMEVFLKKNLPPKKFKKAEKLLDSTQKPLEIGMIPAHPHPQKINNTEDPDFFIDSLFKKDENEDGLKIDLSLNLY